MKPRLEAFFARRAAGIEPGLESIRALLELLGHPERKLRCVHVAGTNGKGSTAAMLERLFRQAGLRTGLYTSPHLVRFHERVRIDGVEIDDGALAARLDEVEAADARNPVRPATFFEMSTAIAFQHFAVAGVDLAVIETGLGGRWDATNVIDPCCSVVTRVSRDHTGYLGEDLAGIAAEKAGILKPGRPGVSAPQEETVRRVLLDAAKEKEAALTFAEEVASYGGDGGTLEVFGRRIESVELSLRGPHQAQNLITAAAAAHLVLADLDRGLDDAGWRAALADLCWPGRFQVVEGDPVLVVDGAHNPAGAEALRRALAEEWPGRDVVWILGFLADKDVEAMLRAFGPAPGRVWFVPLPQRRSMTAEELGALMSGARVADLDRALTEAAACARGRDAVLCLSGSLYLVGEWMQKKRPAHLRASAGGS